MASCDFATGKWTSLTPDDLYQEYSLLTPLLPADVSLWGFNLVSQFQDALSLDLLGALLQDQSYSAPALTFLTSRSSQLSVLRTLHEQAIRHYTTIKLHE